MACRCREATPRSRCCEAQEAAQKLGGAVWVVKAQIHAGGRGKGGGVKLARSVDDVKDAGRPDPGHAADHAPDRPGGQKVRRLLIEEGADIKKEYYVAALTDRATQKVAIMASSEGGMDIEEVAHATPEKIIKVFVDPLVGLTDAQAARNWLPASACPRPRQAAGDGRASRSCTPATWPPTPALAEINPLILEGNGHIKALDAKFNFDSNALFRHPEIVAYRDLDEEDPAEVEASKFDLSLHQPGRQHRLPGQRRGPGDGDDGHHQAVRRRAGQLPRRGRWCHGREGDRGLQDHAQEQEREGHPGQHLRRHHEVRHHRRGRDRGLQGGEPVRCRWWCA